MMNKKEWKKFQTNLKINDYDKLLAK
jgi:hypothetical protein